MDLKLWGPNPCELSEGAYRKMAVLQARSGNVDHKTNVMKPNTRRLVVIAEIGLALTMPLVKVFADADTFRGNIEESASWQGLTSEWWQWALSIPTPQNPQVDTTGENSVVGQRGSVWFLAGVFGGGTVTRTSFLPEGKALFFPVFNDVEINTPNVCGSGSDNVPVKILRAMSAANVRGAANLSVTVDGVPVKNFRRVQSEVFEVTLPANSIFVPLCPPSSVPPGVYSPAVSDGYYVLLNPLRVGKHTLHFYAENPAGKLAQSVTYNFTVVKVFQK